MARPAPRRRSRAGQGPLGAVAARASSARIGLGLTQQELGELAGVSLRSIQALEAGSTVRLDVLLRVLDSLGLALTVVPLSQGRRLEQEQDGAVLLRPVGGTSSP